MSSTIPGVPPEIQRQAKEMAAELWTAIEGTARGSDADPVQLERIKPMVLQALEIAFSHGALISVKEADRILGQMARKVPKRRLH